MMNIAKLPTVVEVQQEMETLGGCNVSWWQASSMLQFFLRCLSSSMTVEPGMLEQDLQ